MKQPKFILRIGFQEWIIPSNTGLSALSGMLEDAMPVDYDGHANEITLSYTDEDDASMLATSTMVSIKKIPPGVKFKRKTKDGRVEIIRPVPIAARQPKAATKAPRLAGRQPLQLEFVR